MSGEKEAVEVQSLAHDQLCDSVDAEADAVAYCVQPRNDTRPFPDVGCRQSTVCLSRLASNASVFAGLHFDFSLRG